VAVHQQTIRELLSEFGWELVEARPIAYLWVAEIWLIRSTWSPRNCMAYLTFEIDPQADPSDVSRVWAVKASLSRPLDWATDEPGDGTIADSAILTLPIAKEKHLESFAGGLAKIRDEFALHVN
jgi:hypothetical protein